MENKIPTEIDVLTLLPKEVVVRSLAKRIGIDAHRVYCAKSFGYRLSYTETALIYNFIIDYNSDIVEVRPLFKKQQLTNEEFNKAIKFITCYKGVVKKTKLRGWFPLIDIS